MAKFVNYDSETGDILGFYDDRIHSSIPTPSLAITDAEWHDCISNNGLRRINPATPAVEVFVPVVVLADEKDYAKSMIDDAASEASGRYISNGFGQALRYQGKADDATAYVDAGYPADTTPYPFITAEVNATGKTATQAADDILSTRSAWITIGASIEEERIGGKVNVDAAADNAEVISARDAAISALDLI